MLFCSDGNVIQSFSYQRKNFLRRHLFQFTGLSVHPFLCVPCVQKLAQIPAVVSKNIANKSCLVCVKSEKYAFWVFLRALWSMKQGKAEIHALQYFARQSRSVFIKTRLSVSSPPQCWSQGVVLLAHLGCTLKVGTS